MQQLGKKILKNDFVNTFEGDDSGDLSPRQTPGSFYSIANPTPVPGPKLLAWNEGLAKEMGVARPTREDVQILGGNKTTSSMKSYASCYAGHQFGNWAGQLGDGRAITLGEWENKDEVWEIQLKGSGPTAYSRGADGRAVLRSSVREYLMSEGIHHLGIPTTRALGLISTGDKVLRDMFYNGNAQYEPGAIVARTAPSFLRFGSFEILTARNEIDHLAKLAHWTIDRFYPQITGEEKILQWFREVVEKTAFLMVEWQRVGFVHGVMNTDNMSILGLTIDYGPFSFLDDYDPNFTPNTTDLPGRRYAFGNQPSIGYWNLGRFASALLPLFDSPGPLENALEEYESIFWEYYYKMMGQKLGFDKVTKEDQKLISDLEEMLSLVKPDMTIFYRLLIKLPEDIKEDAIMDFFKECFYAETTEREESTFKNFIKKYSERIKRNKIPKKNSEEIMKRANPKFILRNYILHQAIEELENGEDQLFRKLEKALKTPYSEDATEFFCKRPSWASKKAGCSMSSCSS